VKELTQKKRL